MVDWAKARQKVATCEAASMLGRERFLDGNLAAARYEQRRLQERREGQAQEPGSRDGVVDDGRWAAGRVQEGLPRFPAALALHAWKIPHCFRIILQTHGERHISVMWGRKLPRKIQGPAQTCGKRPKRHVK